MGDSAMGSPMAGDQMSAPTGLENSEETPLPNNQPPVTSSEPAPSSERTTIEKGNTYAFPVSKEDHDALVELAKQGQGSGVEWSGKEPLKMITAGMEGPSATLTLGESQKPIYLKVYLVNNKDEQKSERKSTRLNSSHVSESRMPSSA